MSDSSDSSDSSETSHPADRATATERLAVGALAFASFAMALNANVFAALAPFLGDALSVDEPQIGWLISTAPLAGGIGALVLGPLVDRIGRRVPVFGGTAAFLVASIGYLVADGFAALIVVRAVTGFAGGIAFTSASAAVADLVPYGRRGAAMGVLTAAIFLAIPVGMPAAVELAEAGHWRAIFLFQIGAAALACLCMVKTLPPELGRGRESVSQWRVLRQPMVLAALLSVLLYTGAFFTAVQFIGTWLSETGLLARGSQGRLWVGLGLASAVGSVVLGRVADRVGKRAYVLWTTAIVALCLALLAHAGSVSMLVLIGTPVAVLSASRSAALLALLSEIVDPRMRGTLMGIRAAAVNLGMGGFAWLGGLVYARHGYDDLLRGAAIAMAIAFLLVRWFVHEREHGRG